MKMRLHKRFIFLTCGVLLIGLVPIFTAAAFLEGFVTRYSSMPVWVSLFILVASLSFIIWYFIIYPVRLEKKMRSL